MSINRWHGVSVLAFVSTVALLLAITLIGVLDARVGTHSVGVVTDYCTRPQQILEL